MTVSPLRAAPAPFPWPSVPRLDRVSIRARRELIARAAAALDWARVGGALGELLGDDVQFAAAEFECRGGAAPPFALAECLALRFPVHGLRLWLRPEPELWRSAVARLLDQEFQLGWADTAVDAALRGAGAALALEVARRAARLEAPELAAEDAARPGWFLCGRASLALGGRPYRVEVCVGLEGAPATAGRRPPAELRRLGALRLRVPWVAALSSVPLGVVERLEVGDVWLPGAEGWVGGEPALTAGLLVPAHSRRGLPVRVLSGRTVLGAEVEAVPEELDASMSQEEPELEQVVGETPVVVRLELGAVEMSAADWAALRPGDVIASGRRLGNP
jgi:hypothetical protein